MANSPRIAVIGSVNVDICGRPLAALVPRDSNPGTMTTSLGGVGTNIARNLRLLGAEVLMITALGSDASGHMAREQLEREGLDLSEALYPPDGRTSTYLYITDDQGDMLIAIADMQIQERLTPEVLKKSLPALNTMDGVVVDANMSREALSFVCDAVTVPIFADGVSAAKVEKLLPVLPRLSALKLNRLEAKRLTGQEELTKIICALNDLGASRGCITLGADGAAYFDGSEMCTSPAPQLKSIRNTTGAGDAFTAAMVWAMLLKKPGPEALRLAQAAAAISLESAEAVNLELSAEKVYSKAETIQSR